MIQPLAAGGVNLCVRFLFFLTTRRGADPLSSRPNPGESRGKSRDGTAPKYPPPGQPAGLGREKGGRALVLLTLAPDSG